MKGEEILKIEVLDIRRLFDNGRSLVAFVDAKFDDWIVVRYFWVIRVAGKLAVELPQTSWKDPRDSLIKYKSIVHFPPDIQKKIEVHLLTSFLEKEERNAPNPSS